MDLDGISYVVISVGRPTWQW